MHAYTGGERYHGEYKNDYRHGLGLYWTNTEYYTLQKMYIRKYDEGVLKEEQEVYTGLQRISTLPGSGFGTYIDEYGTRYEGDHDNYMRNGKGTLTSRDGTLMIGTFVNDKKHGIFVQKTVDNKYFYMEFKDDVLLYKKETDRLNFDNFYWYDEGGFASHN
eukprot:TRINITY_DN6684_c0_g2_i1.p1 TRINITY_DN6684_c0_g2~~TRINITY_DN6684_c0_g2_i1.p1  ORF type:complete len:161 (-),score=27.29 TRINITY_DN6684_c0_g2_i1:25-507(-)